MTLIVKHHQRSGLDIQHQHSLLLSLVDTYIIEEDMETPRMRPGMMMPRFPLATLDSQDAPMEYPQRNPNPPPPPPNPMPNPYYFPMHPAFFPWFAGGAHFNSFGALPPPPMPEDEGAPQQLAIEAGPSTSRALIVLPKATQKDTPASYPMPPCEDPDNPPSAIHPYLYNEDCPVAWDVRMNLTHSARRIGGERLSSVALKAPAINAGGLNHTTMRIVCGVENFPWTITITRDSGISVSHVLMEIGAMLDKEITDSELWIARVERVQEAEAFRLENEGTGAVKTREKGDLLRRVDWLGKKTRFRGLRHSSARDFDTLIKRRVHAENRAHTWVMILEDRDSE
ncbi:hypothetical protein FRB96_000159 [Tulasnella sp. 330]|nr:hypothetical protein FRB96_000159 [Tulasnella sp. 330]